MPETVTPIPIPRSFVEAPTAAMSVGFHFLTRRSTAIADYWRSLAEVRQPTELMAVQLNYWTQLVDDYQEALSESITQLSTAEEEAQAAAKARRAAPAAHAAH